MIEQTQPSDTDLAVAKAIIARAMTQFDNGVIPSIVEVGQREADALTRLDTRVVASRKVVKKKSKGFAGRWFLFARSGNWFALA